MTSFTIVHRDEVERNGNWALLRRALGLGSFGMGLVEIPPGDLPDVVRSPYHHRHSLEGPRYESRPLASPFRARLRVFPWEDFETKNAKGSSTYASFFVMGKVTSRITRSTWRV